MIIGRKQVRVGRPFQLSSGSGAMAFLASGKAELEVVCAWCGDVQVAEGVWARPVSELKPGPVSHGICRHCLSNIRKRNARLPRPCP